MSRLFLTERELNFISDITKELIKDCVGQVIYYYAINEVKTKTHGVYNEAQSKVFDPPISIDCLVSSNFETETKTNSFGPDAQYKIEVYIQWRDLVDKGINVCQGDFFSFGEIMYEITDRVVMRNIYGLAEHKDGLKVTGIKSRNSQFNVPIIGPTDIGNTDADAVQNTFYQQRGQAENQAGQTGDKRDLIANGTLDAPLGGPREVSTSGDDDKGTTSSFYDEE